MQRGTSFSIWTRDYVSKCVHCPDVSHDPNILTRRLHPPEEKSRKMEDEILAAPEVTIPFEPSDPSEVVVSLVSSDEEDEDDVILIVEEKSTIDKAERQRRRQKKKDLWAARKLEKKQQPGTSWQRGPRPQGTSNVPPPPQQQNLPPPKSSPIAGSTQAPTVSQQPYVPNFVHTNSSTSTQPEISLNINSDLALLIRLGPDGRPILTRVENVEETNASTSTTTTTRKLPPPPPPPKISFDTQTGDSLLNGEFVRRPNIDITTDCGPPPSNPPPTAVTVSPPTSKTSSPPTSKSPPRPTPRNLTHTSPTTSSSSHKSRRPLRDPLASSPSPSPSPPLPSPTSSRTRHTSSANIPPPLEPLFLNATQLIHLIKTCRKCEKSFPSRRDGVIHQKKEHNRKHCPVCFLTLSRQGNTYKDHLNLYHALEGDKEMVVCPFCSLEHSFDGLYNHIGRSHLIPVEARAESEQEVMFSVVPSPHGNGHQTRSVTGNTPPKNSSNSPPNQDKRRPGPASRTRKANDPIPSTSRNTGVIGDKYVPDVVTPGRPNLIRNVYPPATNRANSGLISHTHMPTAPRNKSPPPSTPVNNLRRKNPTPPPPTAQPPPKKAAKQTTESGINEKIQAAIKVAQARSSNIERSAHHPSKRSDVEVASSSSSSRTSTSRSKVPTSKTNSSTRKNPSPPPPPPPQVPPKPTTSQAKLALSKVQKAKLIEDVRSIVRRASPILDGEVASSSQTDTSPTPRSTELKAIHISKLNLIYQQLKCYPDAKVIANTAKECGVEVPVVAKWFTKKHMAYCQQTQQRKRKRKMPEFK